MGFIYRQCLGFLGEREAEAHRKRRKHVRLCIDKRDDMINWRSRDFRRNIQFTSIATVEGKTGYVLGHHLNYDPEVSQTDVTDLAMADGDSLAGSRPISTLNRNTARRQSSLTTRRMRASKKHS